MLLRRKPNLIEAIGSLRKRPARTIRLFEAARTTAVGVQVTLGFG